ncbi:hypothetical protein [Myroides profundi]|uniref:DUF4595 domain-containing protein n=1 Tax=Myroides profundi TaxID=480520 RepID=A0AAJ4W562_MYRPR|nr:hypothetical protein [Myroides profundi]AJH16298.1 hypothetical protein MPR_3172 [Myroides profundi]SEQ60569.1 hypothetical protein SAMN04488089_104183 [Myroides profundi]
MKSISLVLLLLLIFPIAWGQPITVVERVIEKQHIPKAHIISITPNPSTDQTDGDTEVFIRHYDFTYNTQGVLISTSSYTIENDMPSYPFTTYIEMKDKHTIKNIDLGSDTSSYKLEYIDKLLSSFIFTNSNFRETRTSTYNYNTNLLPSQITISTIPEQTNAIEISLEYNDKLSLNREIYNGQYTDYTYDNKKYPFCYLPYGYTISSFLGSESLIFTNYIQQNNVIRIENVKFITSIDYTYNKKGFPITARITSIDKEDKNNKRLLYEYEFIYKELHIPIMK